MRRAPIWPPTRLREVGSSWAYVCLPGDLANRQIAGHSVGVGHDADLVCVLSSWSRPFRRFF